MAQLIDLRSELEELVEREANDARVPGVAVGVVHGDEELVVTRGVTSLEHSLDVDRRTLFQVGSTTNTFTATAIMRLVDDGRLALHDRVRDDLPSFRLAGEGDTERLTVQHLLTHCGGWSGDWFL